MKTSITGAERTQAVLKQTEAAESFQETELEGGYTGGLTLLCR